jgi:hypothetical protein
VGPSKNTHLSGSHRRIYHLCRCFNKFCDSTLLKDNGLTVFRQPPSKIRFGDGDLFCIQINKDQIIGCERSNRCAAHFVWEKARNQLRQTLREATFTKLLQEDRNFNLINEKVPQ